MRHPKRWGTTSEVEVLSYIDGDCADYPLDARWTGVEMMSAAARLLRRFHDAQTGFRPPRDSRWRAIGQSVENDGVICHNDVAPHNTVLRPDGSLALIDFDFAGPGSRAYDIGHAVWKWVPLYSDIGSAEHGWLPPYDRPGRLRAFVDAYGLAPADRPGLVSLIRRPMVDSVEGIRRLAEAGEPALVRIWEEHHAEGPATTSHCLTVNVSLGSLP